jgi:DNA (cytosine-5)-methyltransferase 1
MMIHDYFIDLFCGAGGVTTGIHMTGKAEVIACVNHDKNAILSHAANHPDTLHFTEDIRTLDLTPIIDLVRRIRGEDPLAVIHLWASLECVNFSKAKGGLPRDADSRTLANDLFRYIDDIDPDHIWIENVREFMAWGPLDGKGKPVSRLNGQDYVRWCNQVQGRGYDFDWRLLCCADFGDYTSRTRYFAQFARKGRAICWPTPTHAKKVQKGDMFSCSRKPWKAVKEVLDLEDFGQSIFERKKPLVDASLKRILAGLKKFVPKGQSAFLAQYYSGRPAGKVKSVNGPSPTITTSANISAILIQYNGKPDGQSIAHSLNDPAITLSTRDRLGLVQFVSGEYSQGMNLRSVEGPAPTILAHPKQKIVTAQFIIDAQFGNTGQSVNVPISTITASRHEKYITTAKGGATKADILPGDSETMIEIKRFMAAQGISDIMMRMLRVDELKLITGLPVGYVLYGTQGDQKKFIGNAVPTRVVKAMVEASVAANYSIIQKFG